jgi:hypothetical protein
LGGVVIGVRREEDSILPDRWSPATSGTLKTLLVTLYLRNTSKFVKNIRQFDANIKAIKSRPL